MANTNWTPNETQKLFLGALADGTVKSLKQINAELGKEIKTGSINTLISKGMVKSIADGVEYSVKVVETRTYADGTEIVIEKSKVSTETGYQLAQSQGRRPIRRTVDGKVKNLLQKQNKYDIIYMQLRKELDIMTTKELIEILKELE